MNTNLKISISFDEVHGYNVEKISHVDPDIEVIVTPISKRKLRDRIEENGVLLWSDGDIEEPSTRIYLCLFKTGSFILIHYIDDFKEYLDSGYNFKWFVVDVEDNLI